ncbi:MAG: CsbD family protein [Hyphomicrobium sp.]
MGSTKDKITGMANQAVGNIKQGVGKAVGSEKLQAEGIAQEFKGDAQKAVGTAKAAVKDSANKTAEYLNKKL